MNKTIFTIVICIILSGCSISSVKSSAVGAYKIFNCVKGLLDFNNDSCYNTELNYNNNSNCYEKTTR